MDVLYQNPHYLVVCYNEVVLYSLEVHVPCQGTTNEYLRLIF